MPNAVDTAEFTKQLRTRPAASALPRQIYQPVEHADPASGVLLARVAGATEFPVGRIGWPDDLCFDLPCYAGDAADVRWCHRAHRPSTLVTIEGIACRHSPTPIFHRLRFTRRSVLTTACLECLMSGRECTAAGKSVTIPGLTGKAIKAVHVFQQAAEAARAALPEATPVIHALAATGVVAPTDAESPDMAVSPVAASADTATASSPATRTSPDATVVSPGTAAAYGSPTTVSGSTAAAPSSSVTVPPAPRQPPAKTPPPQSPVASDPVLPETHDPALPGSHDLVLPGSHEADPHDGLPDEGVDVDAWLAALRTRRPQLWDALAEEMRAGTVDAWRHEQLYKAYLVGQRRMDALLRATRPP